MAVNPRLRRLFASDGRCFDVAVDHGFFNDHSFLDGIESMPDVVAALVRAAPDAIQLGPGTAPLLQQLPGPKPALVLRVDVSNVYAPKLQRAPFSELTGAPVELALRLDAAAVIVNLLLVPHEPDLHRQCIANAFRIKPECDRWGMPLMVEPLVMKPSARGYTIDGTLETMVALVRQAVELGADVIKADACDDLTRYHEVVRTAGGVPVLVRGGGKIAESEILARTELALAQGAAGIVYGRNVIQHRDPVAMTRALMAVVHTGATAVEALTMLGNADVPTG